MSVVQDKHLHAASVRWSPAAVTAGSRLAWLTAADRYRATTTATDGARHRTLWTLNVDINFELDFYFS